MRAGLGGYTRPEILLRQALGLVLPRRCPFCGQVLGWMPQCLDCAGMLKNRARHPQGRNLPLSGIQPGTLAWAASAFWYEGTVRSAIRQAKYDRKPWIAVQLGCLLAQQMFGVRVDVRGGVEIPQPAADPVTDCDLIVPMASSGRGRAYNVPALMAYPLGHGLGIPVDEAALLRTRRGTAQAGLSGQERVINAMGLFRADADRVAGRRVLLLDDVITTGSTVSAAAQALLYAGAEWVGAVSFAVPWENQTLPAYPGVPFEGRGEGQWEDAGPGEDEEIPF